MKDIEILREAVTVGDWDAVADIIHAAEERFTKGLYSWSEYTAVLKALAGIEA